MEDGGVLVGKATVTTTRTAGLHTAPGLCGKMPKTLTGAEANALCRSNSMHIELRLIY